MFVVIAMMSHGYSGSTLVPPFDEALGCFVNNDCVSVAGPTGPSFLANQTLLISKSAHLVGHYEVQAHIEVFANSNCTLKAETIEWKNVPIIYNGESTTINSTSIAGLIFASKVAWDLNSIGAFNDLTLWLQFLVDEFNAFDADCRLDALFSVGVANSVKRKNCAVLQSCNLNDMLYARKLPGIPKQITVSAAAPTCSADGRVEAPAGFWLTKEVDVAVSACGERTDQ